jgi:hypothetical protein
MPKTKKGVVNISLLLWSMFLNIIPQSSTLQQDKLECLSTAKNFQPWSSVASMAGAYKMEHLMTAQYMDLDYTPHMKMYYFAEEK